MKLEISNELKLVIKSSWFTIEKGVYVYAKVFKVLFPEKHLMVTRDSDEITVVTEVSNLKYLEEYERNPENWILFNIKCGNPFYCEGFLAAIATAFAIQKIDITLTSTFTNDYLMVQQKNIAKAEYILETIGFSKKENRI